MSENLEKISRLYKLLEQGALNEVEFNRLKSVLLSQEGKPQAVVTTTLPNHPVDTNQIKIQDCEEPRNIFYAKTNTHNHDIIILIATCLTLKFLGIEWAIIFFITILSTVFFVYRDIKVIESQGPGMDGVMWAGLIFVIGIITLPMYILKRKSEIESYSHRYGEHVEVSFNGFIGMVLFLWVGVCWYNLLVNPIPA